jgi:hypothetical protein
MTFHKIGTLEWRKELQHATRIWKEKLQVHFYVPRALSFLGGRYTTILSAIQVYRFYEMCQGIKNNLVHIVKLTASFDLCTGNPVNKICSPTIGKTKLVFSKEYVLYENFLFCKHRRPTQLTVKYHQLDAHHWLVTATIPNSLIAVIHVRHSF